MQRVLKNVPLRNWQEWVSAGKTRNYVLGDPIQDYLKRFYPTLVPETLKDKFINHSEENKFSVNNAISGIMKGFLGKM